MAFSYYITDLFFRHFFMGENIPSPVISTPYFGLVTGHSILEGDGWIEVDQIWNPSYARASFTPTLEPTRYYVYQHADNGNVSFPTVGTGEDWGDVIGVVLYDDNTPGIGNVIFECPWNTGAPLWQTVPSYRFDSGLKVEFVPTAVGVNIEGNATLGYYDVQWGGTSLEYCKIIMDWVFNFHTVPYARTYDVAIGNGCDLNYDDWGRWNGIWSECSGRDYNRIPMTADDWYSSISPTYIGNTDELVFTEGALENWGTITDAVLYVHNTDIAAFWGHLDIDATVNTGNSFIIAQNGLKIYMEGSHIELT